MNKEINLELQRLLLEKGIDMPLRTTIADVVMWFFEKYGIWINVIQTHTGHYQPRIQLKDKGNSNHTKNIVFNSPTEAYETAITYSLKNLIK